MPYNPLTSLLDSALDRLKAPPWLVDEVQQRIVLLVNHILMQEAEAQSRLSRQKGRKVHVRWRSFAIDFVVPPAGLLELSTTAAAPDLALTVMDQSPLELLRKALDSAKPEVRIEGDVQLAAEVNWLADHLRWDIEEDLSRVLGDAPAHALGQAARGAASALHSFVASRRPASPPAPGA